MLAILVCKLREASNIISVFNSGLGDISHAICMRISAVKPVP